MKTAVIYARFSCSKQREASIEDQVRVCREYCEHEGIEVVNVYSDYAVSGRTDDRPAFQRMIANAGESDHVVVYMMDRFSRDPYDAPIYKKQLKKAGMTLLSAMERIDPSPDGLIMEKLLEGLAARESMITSIRVKRGMRGNALQCRYNGYKVYGYKAVDGKYEIDEAEAECVRHAFDMRAEGQSFNQIAAYLRSMGVTTTRGKPCTPSMANHMIRNRKYKGVYHWDDVEVPGGMPAIVDEITWDKANRAIGKKDKSKETFDEYILSSKSFCGVCGGPIQGASGRNRIGEKYCYYRCKDKHVIHRRETVEKTIVDYLREILATDEAVRIAQEVKKVWCGTDSTESYERAVERLKAAQKGKDNIIKAVESGMEYSMVKERLDELLEIEMRAKADIEMHKHDIEFNVDDFVEFLRYGATLDDRTLLEMFVWQVAMFESCLVVTLNYDEKENTPKREKLEVFAENQYGGPNVFVHEHIIYIVIPLAA